MRHERIRVTRDNNTIHNLAVAPWEIPVLEYIFDEANVVRQGTYDEVAEAREYPNPAQEMERLIKVYGQDNESKLPYAVSVYGAARLGVQTLATAINAARNEDLKVAKKPKIKRGRTFSGDDLLN